MRVESERAAGNSGWIHKLDGRQREYQPVAKKPAEPITHGGLDKMLERWSTMTNGQVGKLAFDLGVSDRSLNELECVWAAEHRAFAFPMRDANNQVVGIRLRNNEGRKWAVTGSHQGLFYAMAASQRLETSKVAICEGPTDTAACLSLGIFAIGRPACRGCEENVISVLRQLGATEAIVIYDNDGPGVAGAEKLAAMLPIRTTRFVPPCKDLRKFLQSQGTRELLFSLANNAIRTRR